MKTIDYEPLPIHVYIIANPIGGHGKVSALIPHLIKSLKTRFPNIESRDDNEKKFEEIEFSTDTLHFSNEMGEKCDIMFTMSAGDGIRIAAEVANEIAGLSPKEVNMSFVVAIGGDGTLSEVVHGLSEGSTMWGQPTAHFPNLIYLSAGTGADFARLGLCCRSVEDVMTVINSTFFLDPSKQDITDRPPGCCQVRRVDIGSVTHLETNAVRYFINEASVGLSSAVVLCAEKYKRNRLLSCFGGSAVFLAASATELFKMKPRRFRIKQLPFSCPVSPKSLPDEVVSVPMDSPRPECACPASRETQKAQWEQGDWVYLDSTALAFGNGQYFGGGMKITPHGEPCDQSLAIASWGETSAVNYVMGVASLYSGRATMKWGSSRMFSGSRILVECAPQNDESDAFAEKPPKFAAMEADGEPIGSLPAVVEISHQMNFCLPFPKTSMLTNNRKK